MSQTQGNGVALMGHLGWHGSVGPNSLFPCSMTVHSKVRQIVAAKWLPHLHFYSSNISAVQDPLLYLISALTLK